MQTFVKSEHRFVWEVMGGSTHGWISYGKFRASVRVWNMRGLYSQQTILKSKKPLQETFLLLLWSHLWFVFPNGLTRTDKATHDTFTHTPDWPPGALQLRASMTTMFFCLCQFSVRHRRDLPFLLSWQTQRKYRGIRYITLKATHYISTSICWSKRVRMSLCWCRFVSCQLLRKIYSMTFI